MKLIHFRNLLLKTALFAVFITISSCKKDEIPPIVNVHKNAPGDYLNSAKNNYWIYTTNDTSNWRVDVPGLTKFYGNKNYTYFKKTVNGTSTYNYYAYANRNYFSLITDGNGANQELIYLKDSLKPGEKWSQTIVGTGGSTLTYNFETISVDMQYSGPLAQGSTVKIKLSIPEIGYTCESYYMHWIGLVSINETFSQSGLTYKTDVTSYTLGGL